MKDTPTILAELQERFTTEEIEWRIGRSGKKADGSLWATALAYINNRAIMNRLDHAVGAENWKNEFHEWRVGEDHGVLCGLSVRINGEWVTKWDGAENTDIESVKGGLSDSMKRAGVQWGIGRYLYNLDETWVECSDKATKSWNRGYNAKEKFAFWWKTPNMPAWADPDVNKGAVDSILKRMEACKTLADFVPIRRELETIRDTLNDSDYRRLMDGARATLARLGGSASLIPSRS